jgi:hypothetical protein
MNKLSFLAAAVLAVLFVTLSGLVAFRYYSSLESNVEPAANLEHLVITSDGVKVANKAWANTRISVPSLHFSMGLPKGWLEMGGKSKRESLAKSAAAGKPLKIDSSARSARAEIINARLTSDTDSLRNPCIKVSVYMYGEVGKRDAVNVANDWLALRSWDNISHGDAEEITIDGKPSAVIDVTGKLKDSSTNEYVDLVGSLHTIVFGEYFIVINSIRRPDESQVVIDDMANAIASIKID